MRPDVSIIVPAYQAERYIAGALASIRDSVPDGLAVETVVVDSGSTDFTIELVETLARRDGCITVIRPGVRLTAPQARNVGFAHAAAPVIALLDNDDQMAPNRLANHHRALVADPTLAAVGGPFSSIDEAGIPLAKASDPEQSTSQPPLDRGAPLVTRYLLPRGSPTLSSGLTIRADALRAVGGFVEDAPYADDYHLMWRLCQAGGIRMLASRAAFYRVHPQQASQRSRALQELEVLLLRRRILAEFLGHEPPLSTVVALARPESKIADSDRELAVADLDLYHRAFRSRLRPDEDESAAIDDVHRRWRSRIADGGSS